MDTWIRGYVDTWNSDLPPPKGPAWRARIGVRKGRAGPGMKERSALCLSLSLSALSLCTPAGRDSECAQGREPQLAWPRDGTNLSPSQPHYKSTAMATSRDGCCSTYIHGWDGEQQWEGGRQAMAKLQKLSERLRESIQLTTP